MECIQETKCVYRNNHFAPISPPYFYTYLVSWSFLYRFPLSKNLFRLICNRMNVEKKNREKTVSDRSIHIALPRSHDKDLHWLERVVLIEDKHVTDKRIIPLY